MPNPALTTDYSDSDAKAELTKFFWDRSINALEQSIQHLCDRDFYTAVQDKLKAGADLSEELPEIKRLSSNQILSVLESLEAESIASIESAWTLKAGASQAFSTSFRSSKVADSNIPCFDIEYSANTDDGIAKVHVTTWRRNVDINITGTDKAAEAASKKLLMAGLRT
jgi:hypothetical protein